MSVIHNLCLKKFSPSFLRNNLQSFLIFHNVFLFNYILFYFIVVFKSAQINKDYKYAVYGRMNNLILCQI